MHSRVSMWWTDERIRYYTVSAEHTDFHETLARAIAAHVDEGEGITELGAGLGYVTERLMRMGLPIRGYDSDGRAVRLCNGRTGTDLLEQRDVLTDPPPGNDVILMVFFGRMTETDSLDRFLSMARHKVISVISHHNGHGIRKRRNRKEETEELLRARGLTFTVEDMTIPFDQPLKDRADAEAFAEAFYDRGTEIETEASGYEDFPLVFRNTKNISIFTILKEEGKI